MNNILVMSTGEVVNEHMILQVTGGEFDGVEFFYDYMKFADKENDDGSINMTFDYVVTKGQIKNSQKEEFHHFLGDQILLILEEQIARGEVVYHSEGEGEILES